MKLSQFFRKNGWCQNSLAVDQHGANACPMGSDAVSWCIRGAAMKLGKDIFELDEEFFRHTGVPASSFNDYAERTKDDVINTLKSMGY